MEEERYNFINGIVDEEGKVLVPGCIRNGITAEAGNKIFDQMMDFASYAFNKSHAAAYAVVGYDTAYLTHYYPAEYIAAMLNSIMGNNEKVEYYIRFADKMGIQVLPPDINESNSGFTVKGNTIRFGLSAIKNVGVNVIESIVKSRKEKGDFISFNDFANKIDITAVNKRAVESLIKAGAFDSLGVYRSRLCAVFEKVMDGVSTQKKRNIEGQISLFDAFGSSGKEDAIDASALDIKYPEIEEFKKKYLLAMEKEMTGIYLSGHPLDEYENTLNMVTSHKTIDLLKSETLEEGDALESQIQGELKVNDGDKIIIGGLITTVSRKITKNNTMMAFLNLEDLYGSVEVIVFPKTYDKYRSLVEEEGLVVIEGRVSVREDEPTKVLCQQISPLVNASKEKIYVLIPERKSLRSAMKEIEITSREYKGNTPVCICTADDRKKYMADKEIWLNNEYDCIEEIKKVFGEGNVKVM